MEQTVVIIPVISITDSFFFFWCVVWLMYVFIAILCHSGLLVKPTAIYRALP